MDAKTCACALPDGRRELEPDDVDADADVDDDDDDAGQPLLECVSLRLPRRHSLLGRREEANLFGMPATAGMPRASLQLPIRDLGRRTPPLSRIPPPMPDSFRC